MLLKASPHSRDINTLLIASIGVCCDLQMTSLEDYYNYKRDTYGKWKNYSNSNISENIDRFQNNCHHIPMYRNYIFNLFKELWITIDLQSLYYNKYILHNEIVRYLDIL